MKGYLPNWQRAITNLPIPTASIRIFSTVTSELSKWSWLDCLAWEQSAHVVYMSRAGFTQPSCSIL